MRKILLLSLFLFLGTATSSEPSDPIATNIEMALEEIVNDVSVAPIQEDTHATWSTRIQKGMTKGDSFGLKFLFAFLLGILMSLTPCIYPMIPITVGILQSQASKSVLKNFLLSSMYTLGLATTFATMGLMAASSGEAFGHLLANPLFVIAIVITLCYFAFSLFGFYNLYIPRFLQNKNSMIPSGSYLSIFTFGIISGSVASPCLSPGLALILTMVATLANKLLGFLLLFAFGIGVSTPLLIIGTFSSSLSVLPRAGMWMLEVQKIFGFMLLGMCFYYLGSIIPQTPLTLMFVAFLICIGCYYIYSSLAPQSIGSKIIRNLIGFFVIGVALYIGIFTVLMTMPQAGLQEQTHVTTPVWITDFEEGHALAVKENKPMLIDFWAPFCSICKIITKKVLLHKTVYQELHDNFVVVMIDITKKENEKNMEIKEEYQVHGVPTLLIINPHTKQELARWASELYDKEVSEVAQDLKSYRL